MIDAATNEAIVFVVDDDQSVRDALQWLIESIDLPVQTYDSAAAFLNGFSAGQLGCLVLDVRMPGTSGLELQELLAEKKIDIPIIIITGHGDVPMCVRAFEGGAFAFLEKPVNHQQLLEHIQRAVEEHQRSRQQSLAGPHVSEQLSTLTPREREVMDLIAAGKTMKQIASKLQISIQTSSKHRAKVLEKMGADNDVELVKLLLTTNQEV